MESLCLHESVPGHHLQIALAQEIENLPAFRRFTGPTAFVEGWGLYAESLGEELGHYRDPYAKMGQYMFDMWRSIRLVVDTGIHALGWSRDDAIRFFRENTGKSEVDIAVEVDRYIVWPGQALAYKIGQLKFRELRALAERELGDRFDPRTFHDRALEAGAVPLGMLDARVRTWVTAQRSAAPSS
jgi:prolyl oligopeptidase